MNCNASTSVLLVLLITGITLLGSCGFVTAEETSSSTGSPDVQVVPLSGTIIPVDDGKEIHWVEEGSPLEIWWQKTIVGFISFFQGTILENVVLILIPIVSALLGVLCIGIFTSANKRIKSPVSENILLCIRENPGITQKQITGTVRCSRGSVCYHLHQLEKTGKIRKLHLGTTPQYYPSAELPSPDTLIEQTILLLLSRKKSGRFLRTLYEHPGITQKELAALLNIRPTTAHWYLHTYTKSRILSIEQNGRELHYSLTREAETIFARLIPDTQNP